MQLLEKKFFSWNEAICLSNYDGTALCRGRTRDAEQRQKKAESWFSASSESAKVFSDSWLQDYDCLECCSVILPKFLSASSAPRIEWQQVGKRRKKKKINMERTSNQEINKSDRNHSGVAWMYSRTTVIYVEIRSAFQKLGFTGECACVIFDSGGVFECRPERDLSERSEILHNDMGSWGGSESRLKVIDFHEQVVER